ncbi:MAG: phosphonate C-P lyase system protein PhnH [Deltaproteobacteria bacterium]|jgi:alpha-D-ribose 1-methylphosphonate 5-triphosphate synthase subunit PhnH|nr:phosphonate C-P lyase system protein PhnH [Deltaproteobacteria bacterium]
MGALDTGTFAPGLKSHPYGSQRVFRAALAALASPAEAVEADFAGLFAAPPPLDPAAAALALTLCDQSCGLWLSPSLAHAGRYFAFHAGARPSGLREASFAVAASPAEAPRLSELNPGTECRPELSATLIVCGALDGDGPALSAAGPGIRGPRILSGHGLPPGFVEEWRLARAQYPLGIDVFLTGRGRLLGLPRTTALELAGQAGGGACT